MKYYKLLTSNIFMYYLLQRTYCLYMTFYILSLYHILYVHETINIKYLQKVKVLLHCIEFCLVHKIANECKLVMNSYLMIFVSIYEMHKLIILVLFDMYLLSGHTKAVMSVAFSGDGSKVVSGSFDKTVNIWDANNGALIQTLSGDVDIRHMYVLFHCNTIYYSI